jgi:glycyl-tRNA synthetase
MPADRIDSVVSLAKRRGFVYPSSEIYGGTRSAWDYGPLGVELKENVRRQWWRTMVQQRDDIVGIDSASSWPAGLGGLRPHRRVRRPADRVHQLPQAFPSRPSRRGVPGEEARRRLQAVRAQLPQLRQQGHLHRAKMFNGLDEDLPGRGGKRRGLHYLRPETAQGIFVNYKNVETTARMKPPFGIAQVGKSFRNEITPGTSSSARASSSRWRWSSSSSPAPTRNGTSTGCSSAGTGTSTSGIKPENMRFFEHPKEKLSHYSKRTVDIEYRFQFGGTEFSELEGIANRTDFDLTDARKHSGVDLSYFDQDKQARWSPMSSSPRPV